MSTSHPTYRPHLPQGFGTFAGYERRVERRPALPRRVHLVGAAGAGMSALAEVLTQWGVTVTGSDIAIPSVATGQAARSWLSRHDPAHVTSDIELVVHSDAVPADNPELKRAQELGIPIRSYFQTLGQIGAGRRAIGVAGTHGKSTTTAMLAAILTHAGHDPTVFCGAVPRDGHSGGRAGQGHLMVVEACEYRENFLQLRLETGLILGIEPDHFDYYQSLDHLHRAFRRFAEAVPPRGLLLVRHDCPATREVARRMDLRIDSFGFDESAGWSARLLEADAACWRFEIRHVGRALSEVCLRVPGRHNVLNALAAAAVAFHYGASSRQIREALEAFVGLRRRLEPLDAWRGIERWDDFAHHPTEISAALATLRERYPGRPLRVVFQPHQASRTARLLDELAASLHNTDKLYVAEIYRAREPAWRPGEVTAADLAERARAQGIEVAHTHDLGEIAALLQVELAAGDVLATIGAGDVARLHALLHAFPREQ